MGGFNIIMSNLITLIEYPSLEILEIALPIAILLILIGVIVYKKYSQKRSKNDKVPTKNYQDIHRHHANPIISPKPHKEWETNGIYAYFNYVSEPKNRKELQKWWRNRLNENKK